MAGKKQKAESLTLCIKCGGEIFRSAFRNFGEVLISPIQLPFRCSRCGWRQFRSSFSRVRDKDNYRRAATDRQ
jgi:ribosomal protein L37E